MKIVAAKKKIRLCVPSVHACDGDEKTAVLDRNSREREKDLRKRRQKFIS
jgi:hypothetical protein